MSKLITSITLIAAAGGAVPADLVLGDRIAVASTAGEPLKTIQIMPLGRFKSKRDGREWVVSDAEKVVQASAEAAAPADIPADYDHQLVFAARDGVGGTAPASGWIKNLRVEGGFIVADPEWTAAATARIKDKEYRYISPVFSFDSKTREVGRILNVALTNFPALTQLAAVAAGDLQGNEMELEALAAALGLGKGATIEQIIAAATALNARASGVSAIATAAGLASTASADEIAAAFKGKASVDPAKYVPIEQLNASNARITALETAAATTAATALVNTAIASGKVTPANRAWAEQYAAENPAGFATFLEKQPVIAAATARTDLTPPFKDAETVADLDADQLAACQAIGITPEDFLKSQKEMVANGRA